MINDRFTCPRCFVTVPVVDGMRFCPHCGLPDAKDASLDNSSIDVNAGGKSFRVEDRVAIGSICTIYRCQFRSNGSAVEGTIKIARDACANQYVANEADVLRRLHARDSTRKFSPFLPMVEESFGYRSTADTSSRQANVLRMHNEIRSPADELYTLVEVRQHYPDGLDPKHVAWIWRRLLSILGFVHAQGVVHAAVLPMHVLIEPREHKLVLIDWCCATMQSSVAMSRPLLRGGYAAWYEREFASIDPPTPALDIALATRCMIELLGGDPVAEQFPSALPPALKRYFERCLGAGARSSGSNDAWKLLDDFDRVIEALWGPRQFRELTLPPKRT